MPAKCFLLLAWCAGLPLLWWRGGAADGWFFVLAWLSLGVLVGWILWAVPTLRCPSCDRATGFLDNYTQRVATLTGNFRRNILCRHCGAGIDRLTHRVVGQLTREQTRSAVHFATLWDVGRVVATLGVVLLVCSGALATIVAMAMRQEMANTERAIEVLFGCAVAATAGLVLIVVAIVLKKQALRRASRRVGPISTRLRIRW